ncbi:MAG: T9SS type A sorting domain-containing protein [Bacteroidales bacterium]|nr:T9SS type A sorting domain-containing protein [Bacteroidales bacterium]
MKNRFSNLSRNLLLTVLMSITFSLPVSVNASEITKEGYINISSKEAMQIINTYQNIIILDVRDRSYFESGHLTGAVSMPLVEFEKGISSFKKDMTFIVYCQNGRKSRVACETLMKKGFKSTFNLVHGIYEWQETGYPVTGRDICSTCPKSRSAVVNNNKTAKVPVKATAQCGNYCISNGGSHEYERILKVSYKLMSEGILSVTVIIVISNPDGCSYAEACPAYDDSPEYINAWIDWNGNNVYESSERVLNAALTGYIGINYHGTMSTSNIVSIPSGAVNSTSMRVNLGWDFDPDDPCEESWYYGDVTDQPVEIFLDPPEIEEITVTGVPVATNLITSDPSLGGLEKVKLQAKISENPDYEITDYDWTGDIITGKGNPYEYSAPPGSHGNKVVTCIITYKNKINCVVGATILSKDFDLFFNKGGDDDGNNEPNWFRYWKRDGAVPNMGVAKYDASSAYDGYMTDGGELYLTPYSAGQHYSSPIVINSSFGTESFGGPTVKGIDCTAEIIAHELYHKWVNEQWQAGAFREPDSDKGLQAADCWDKLPDTYETNTSKTKNDDTDTYNLETKKGSEYRKYGDNEYMAMRTANGVTGEPFKDWASPGKQTGSKNAIELSLESPKGLTDLAYASFTGTYTDSGVDENSDGLFDYLKVVTGINVTSAGLFRLVARLNDNTLKEITFYNQALTLSQGVQTVDITFDGLKIREKAIDGPYKVTFQIHNEYGDTLDFKPNAYTTASYNYTAFKTKPFYFTGNYAHKYNGMDVYKEFKYLSVSAEVNISTAGSYLCEGALYDENGKVIELQDSLIALDAGTSNIVFNFAGEKIRKNQTNGPYYLKYLSISRNGERDFILDAYYIDWLYLFTEFERAKGIFNGYFAESGVDKDSDNRFDSLKVTIGVNLRNFLNYNVFGYLYDKNGNQISKSNVIGKSETGYGDNLVDLFFDGISIYLHGVDGPYYLKNISLQNEAGNSLDAIISADTTIAYKFTDFQKPANLIELTGNYSDTKTDVNSDEAYEYLTVDAGVMLSDSGFVIIKAKLVDAQNKEIVWAENIAKLKEGTPQVIQLNFRGDSIYKHGVNGPYYVKNVYVYHTGDPSHPDYVVDAYTTAAYQYTEFTETITGISDLDSNRSPFGSYIGDNYPNPFKISTSIKYYIPNYEYVTLKIFDVSGKEVETLVREYEYEGVHQVIWTAKGLPSGIYFCNLKFGNKTETKKLFLLK